MTQCVKVREAELEKPALRANPKVDWPEIFFFFFFFFRENLNKVQLKLVYVKNQ